MGGRAGRQGGSYLVDTSLLSTPPLKQTGGRREVPGFFNLALVRSNTLVFWCGRI